MGGFDIFYTKITINGEGHAVSGNSDLSKLEFSTPINLGAPINSGADDFAMLVQQNGNGGFFISNRTANGANKNNIYRFNQEPYVFNEPGQYLVPRLPATSATQIASETLAAQPVQAIIRTDTVFVEIPVERVVEKEVFVGGGDEQTAILQQKDAQISQLNSDLSACQHSLTQQQVAFSQQLAMVTTAVVDEVYQVDAPAPVAPTPQPVTTPTGIVYRVQVAASQNPPAQGEFRATFDALHRALPDLQMETIRGADGFFRYVTLPFATFAEADAIRRRIQALGYQSFVSGYRGSERVSMSVR
jgi:hypothetical protein